MVRLGLLLTATLATAASGFTTMPVTSGEVSSFFGSDQRRKRSVQPLHMVSASAEGFDDEFFENPINNNNMNNLPSGSSASGNHMDTSSVDTSSLSARFVTGDELHRLRHEVLAMRLDLQEARRSGSNHQVHELEQAIMKAQQVDAEFVYTVSLERMELAQQKGRFQDAEKFQYMAYEARSALPQFNLEGLWVGKYGDHGYEMVNVTYRGDTLVAQKVTGTKNVPKGQVTFEVDLSPNRLDNDELLEPIELGDNAARQWGCKYLQRFAGQGQVAADGYMDSQWIDGQLIMVNEYFSFAWLPIGHQVFFGRPTPELILKLMKDAKRKESGDCIDRAFLEKCWEETEHLEDDHEVSFVETTPTISSVHNEDSDDLYQQGGCFE